MDDENVKLIVILKNGEKKPISIPRNTLNSTVSQLVDTYMMEGNAKYLQNANPWKVMQNADGGNAPSGLQTTACEAEQGASQVMDFNGGQWGSSDNVGLTMGSNNSEDALFEEVGSYYFNNEKLHDVQFIVGEQKEKIKAVKVPLINQSKAWWSMLSEDSPLMEKGDIYLPNIDPEVFTLVLKHSYGGLNNLDDLSDDMVVKLCYCANKYDMKSLMTKIAARLQPKDVDTVFPALHCLAYYNLHGVEDGVKKIVQTQTQLIFGHAEFFKCDVDSITYICKQDALNCDELMLWKAVVNWAKHRAQGDQGPQLRQWMSQPLQHIRLLTLTEQDLVHHVFSSGILNREEIANICQQNTSELSSICNEKSDRRGTTVTITLYGKK